MGICLAEGTEGQFQGQQILTDHSVIANQNLFYSWLSDQVLKE